MTGDNINFIKQWFEKADHDIISAHRLIDIAPAIIDSACFHCQQAIEKYLKAYLIYSDHEIKKTHNLNFLREKCAQIDPDFEVFNFETLNEFGADIRYPDDSLIPTISEAKEYLETAEKIKELVLKKVNLG